MKYARDILLAGGKRFRPVLGCLAYEAAGAKLDDKMLRSALAAEIIHTATLVHDDIYDQETPSRTSYFAFSARTCPRHHGGRLSFHSRLLAGF